MTHQGGFSLRLLWDETITACFPLRYFGVHDDALLKKMWNG